MLKVHIRLELKNKLIKIGKLKKGWLDIKVGRILLDKEGLNKILKLKIAIILKNKEQFLCLITRSYFRVQLVLEYKVIF